MSTQSAHLLPAGQYFIGDPCYVIDSTWDELLLRTNNFNNNGISLFRDLPVWGARTSIGITYTDQNDVEYSIDSGVLGAIPIELIETPSGEEKGTVISAPLGLRVLHLNGIFWFNDICIQSSALPIDIDGEYTLDPNDDKL